MDIQIGRPGQKTCIQPVGLGAGKQGLGQENEACVVVEAMAVTASIQGTRATIRQPNPMAPGLSEPQAMHAVTAVRQHESAQGVSIALGHKDMAVQHMMRVV